MNLVWALSWMLFGVAMGCMAATTKKFPLWQGVVGGLFLGALSPFMFLISPTHKKCKFCQSSIPKEAMVCAKCGRETGYIPPPVDPTKVAAQNKTEMTGWIIAGIVLGVVILGVVIVAVTL